MEERVSRRILCRNEIEGDYKGEKGSEKGSFRREKFFSIFFYIYFDIVIPIARAVQPPHKAEYADVCQSEKSSSLNFSWSASSPSPISYTGTAV